jgi:hypothetical protein
MSTSRWSVVIGVLAVVVLLWGLNYLWARRHESAAIDMQGMTLTVTGIERGAERRSFEGLGAHDPGDVQIQKAGPGLEYAQLTLAVSWLPDRQPLPCNDANAPPLTSASKYVLVDSEGWRAEGLEVSFERPFDPCQALTVLFQPSRVGAVYTALLFDGKRAVLRDVPGHKQ